ncbi:MAG TPA: vanadium-dependent haloperoxidase [Actinomycetota bacterium]|nr:vanadium-dependent haloperoxidase [Actinomycetota bacterium]
MKLKKAPLRIALVAFATVSVVSLIPAGSVAAAPSNTVLNWNATAVAAIFNAPTAATPGAGQAPTVGVINLAMVQGAVYDAVNSIVGGYEPYLDVPKAPRGASVDAAVATAAHDVLVKVLPQVAPLTDTTIRNGILARIDTQYQNELNAIAPSVSKTQGVSAGAAAASAMLLDRVNDGRYPSTPFSFTQGTGIGAWRPTNGASDPFAWVAHVRPFTLRSTSQFRTDGPNPVNSWAYAKEYAEVKDLGAATGSGRTPEQTALATFYIPNPVEIFNRTFRTISTSESLDTAQQARLYAMLNVAGADAFINCWDDKEHWHFWRPVTAIQLGGSDGNHKTEGDTAWQPFISTLPGPTAGTFLPTPPYPDQPSGYNCLTSSMMNTAKGFFGNEMTFTVERTPGGTARTYTRFTDVVRDTIEARIYLGIHFRTADVDGANLGRNVARWVASHDFEPVCRHRH